MEFELPKQNINSIIKVIGVGGGGSNAVNYMYRQGIDGVDFVICNTDQQALDISPVPVKIQLGATLTEGRGAGSIPEKGKNAAIENSDELRQMLEHNTKMIFLTAGMGGGTGTGAAPVIAKIAREMDILTVGIVTSPFKFEGRQRGKQAETGIEELKEHVDTLLVINNDRLREMYGNLSMSEAFAQADNVLTTAAKGIAEIIMRTGYINVDFEDVRTVMTDGGVAIMGSGEASGENRARLAVEAALSSPLLNDNKITGARYVLLNITFGSSEPLMDEISDITDFIQEEAGDKANVIWGYGQDERIGDNIAVTLIATGFPENQIVSTHQAATPQVKKIELAEVSAASQPMPQPTPQPAAVQQKEEKETAQPKEIDLDGIKITVKSVSPEKAAPIQPTIQFDAPKPKPAPQPAPVAKSEPVIKAQKQGFQPLPATPAPQPRPLDNLSDEDRNKRTLERISRLKDLSRILRTPSGITDLENEPAYKRKQVRLEDVPHSSESHVSRFTLTETEGEDGKRKTEIRGNNSFLHDNVD